MSNIILGTAQLGLDYGITNSHGRPSNPQTASLAETAKLLGIRALDTAAAYGDSETRIGDYFAQDYFEVITKFHLTDSPLIEILQNQLDRLRRHSLYGYLFHDVEQLLNLEDLSILDQMRELRDAGKIKKIGVSLYSVEQMEKTLKLFPDVNLLQIPGNLIDVDLLESEVLRHTSETGVEIHVRSVLLQGLLLSNPESLPEHFSDLKPVLTQLSEISQKTGMSRLELVLSKIKYNTFVKGAVLGTSDSSELIALSSAWNSCKPFEFELPLKISKSITDPRLWPKGI